MGLSLKNELVATASDSCARGYSDTPIGPVARIESWLIRFPSANPDRLPLGVLRKSYTVKPLVAINGASMFGELAIVSCLEKDGWTAFWVDTFHGRKFWRGMPHVTQPTEPPTKVKALYARIADRKGGPSGCFDIVASKGDRIIWLEYKGPKDTANRNELCWIEAALGAGVAESSLFFVGSDRRPKAVERTI